MTHAEEIAFKYLISTEGQGTYQACEMYGLSCHGAYIDAHDFQEAQGEYYRQRYGSYDYPPRDPHRFNSGSMPPSIYKQESKKETNDNNLLLLL